MMNPSRMDNVQRVGDLSHDFQPITQRRIRRQPVPQPRSVDILHFQIMGWSFAFRDVVDLDDGRVRITAQAFQQAGFPFECGESISFEAEFEDLIRLVAQVVGLPNFAKRALAQLLTQLPIRFGHDHASGRTPAEFLHSVFGGPCLGARTGRHQCCPPLFAHLTHFVAVIHPFEPIKPVIPPGQRWEAGKVIRAQNGSGIVKHGPAKQDLIATSQIHNAGGGRDL